MNKTTNYNLNLPEKGEFYNVDDFNENAVILDAKLKELSDEIESGGEVDADTLEGHPASDFVPITGGTMEGQLVANGTATATLTTAQIRNASFGTEDLETGVSYLKAGEMYFSYEPVE